MRTTDKEIERTPGPHGTAERILDRLIEKVTRREVWHDLKPELESLGLFLKALQARAPTVGELKQALDDADEAFFDGWTVRRCVDCGEPVAGGPTRCERCVGKLEAGGRKYEIPELDSIEVTEGTVILLRGGERKPNDVEAIARVAGSVLGPGRVVPVISLDEGSELSAGDRDEIVAELDAIIVRDEYLAELGRRSDDELVEIHRRLRAEARRRHITGKLFPDPEKKPEPNLDRYVIREGEPNDEGDEFSADELREIHERLGGELVEEDGKLALYSKDKIAAIPSKGRSAEGFDNA